MQLTILNQLFGGQNMKKAIQYGAGNIGRGFIGQLFSQSGYEVVFIDVNKEIVEKLNFERTYPVRIISGNENKDLHIENVRAVDGSDLEKVTDEISNADIMATAVGVNIIPRIIKPIVLGLKKRWLSGNMQPLNIIICENLMDANKYIAELIKKELSDTEKILFDKAVGLVEASIGRMVPVMTPEMQDGNMLRICVEEYCSLPVDKDAFIGEIPNITNMIPFSPFQFYIQRKLFIHNLGHAITAYLGYLKGYKFIWQAIGDSSIKLISKKAMQESAKALSLEHKIPLEGILDHVNDLIFRFGNGQLGDTIERVGKDPLRKLSPNDRLIGAAKLCEKNLINPVFISIGIGAALCFGSKDEQQTENSLLSIIGTSGIESFLETECGLSKDSLIWTEVVKYYEMLKAGNSIETILEEGERFYYNA